MVEQAANITCKSVQADRKALLDLNSPLWKSASEVTVSMSPTPLANQPSEYIKANWSEKNFGKVEKIKVKSLHNSKEIFFYLEWESRDPNYEIGDMFVFPDGASLLFPFFEDKDTPIKEMGSQTAPTNSWFWRADFDEKPKNQIAKGLSTSLYTDASSLFSASKWEGGKWRVIIGRTFTAKEESVQIKAGTTISIGFAAWEGGNGERGGVKSFSQEWRQLIVAA